MIFRCDCGAMKNGQPFRASGVMPWICEKCSPAKRSREATRAAQEANGGRCYPSQPEKRDYKRDAVLQSGLRAI